MAQQPQQQQQRRVVVLLLLLMGMVVVTCASSVSQETLVERTLQQGGGGGDTSSSNTSTEEWDRLFDTDECKNGENDYGPCDTSKFPVCKEGEELICYNRRPRRDKFYPTDRMPHFYIDYRNVLCYPNTWSGCSSCSPGRYCVSENRCILDQNGYPCAQWF